MEEQSTLDSLGSVSFGIIEERADSVLRSSFDRLDSEFCRLCTEGGHDWDCGSTIVDDVVSLANLGVDCRAVSRDYESDAAEAENDGWEQHDWQSWRSIWDQATILQ